MIAAPTAGRSGISQMYFRNSIQHSAFSTQPVKAEQLALGNEHLAVPDSANPGKNLRWLNAKC
jgi:hypothetical protein